jgi:hypothetical protein
MNQETLTETAILGINKTVQTDSKDHEIDISLASGSGNIIFNGPFHDPWAFCISDFALHISNYYTQGSWNGPLKMILPEPEAREISISWSLLRPEGSLCILILPSLSVTIVFIELKTHKLIIK